MKKKQIIISLVIKSLVVIISLLGVFKGFIEGSSKVFLFFTQQSNIFAAMVSLVLVVFDVLALKNKQVKMPRWLYYVKFAATVGVALTFVVFWTLLAKDMSLEYLGSFDNLSLHTIAPLLMILDYIFFTADYKPTKKVTLSALIPPLAYFIFAMTLMAFDVSFGENMVAPYFFLDYKNNGWFKVSDGIGVFYWLIIVLGIIYLIALLIDLLYKLKFKGKEDKETK